MPKNNISALGTASMMGIHLVVSIFVGALLGYGLDHLLDNSVPYCAGIGLILGIVAGFRSLWLDAKRLTQKVKDA